MNRFTLVRLPSLGEATARVKGDPSRRLFRAGGIDLLDRLKEGLEHPDELVELQSITGEEGRVLRGIQPTASGGWRIGALVTLGQLAAFEDLPSAYDALRQASRSAATPGIRNGATIGGNLLQRPRCWYFRHADLVCLKKGGYECLALTGDNRYNAILGGGPSFIVHASSLAPPLLALDAGVVIWNGEKIRTIPIDDLFAPPTVDPQREHTLAPGEVLMAVELPPAPPDQRSAYRAAKEKQSHDWPLVETAVRLRIDQGRLASVKVALGHVAPIPWHAREADAVLEGQAPSLELFADAARAAVAKAKPLEHNAYKVPLVQGLLRQTLHQCTDIPLPE